MNDETLVFCNHLSIFHSKSYKIKCWGTWISSLFSLLAHQMKNKRTWEESRLLFIFPSIDPLIWRKRNIKFAYFLSIEYFFSSLTWFWSWFLISTNPIEYDQILMLIKFSQQTEKNFSQEKRKKHFLTLYDAHHNKFLMNICHSILLYW